MSLWSPGVKPLAVLGALALATACTSSSVPSRQPSEVLAPEVRTPEVQTPEVRTPEVQTPEVQTLEVPTATGAEQVAAPPSAAASPAKEAQGRLLGIDVSHYQPTVEWETVKSTASFVFIKATDSTSGVDSHFNTHWDGAKKAGLPRGAYHFFHPKHDVDMQVANFTKHVKLDPGELPPVVDVEQFKDEYQPFTCEQLAGMLERFSQGVEKELGRKPMIYTNRQTWSTSFCNHAYFMDHLLWLAAYTHQAEPTLPQGWSRWHFWQYTESGTMAGIAGQVDQSYFNGTAQELKALLSTK